MGDPFARDTVELRQSGFGFEAPTKGFENSLRSWGGDTVKHSSRDGEDVAENASTPAPNLKAGSGLFSLDLKDTVLVE
jgi:hypothetical protein